MKASGKIRPLIIIAVMLLAGLFFYIFIITGDLNVGNGNSEVCEKCRKSKAKSYPNEYNNDERTASSGSGTGYFLKIFSLLGSASVDGASDTVTEKDPAKDQAINDINSLSKAVCNDEKLPEDVWISPKLMEKDVNSHKNELEKLVIYCKGLKSGKATSSEKIDYYKIKIRLLEERKELIKYYIDTLDGQIEDMNDKKIADMEEKKADEKITPDEEKNNSDIEKEMNRFYDEAVSNSNRLIEQIDSAIKNYKAELAKL